MSHLRKTCIGIFVVLLLWSTIVANANDKQIAPDTWTYMGLTFKIHANEENTINIVNAILDDVIVYDSYFRGIDAEAFVKKILRNEELEQSFISANSEIFTLESQTYIKQKYKTFELAEKNYDWYATQINSGKYSNINCGFAAINMILDYFYPSNNKTTKSLRDESLLTGKLDMTQVSNILSQNNITANCFSINTGTYNLYDMVDYPNELGILAIDTGFYTNDKKTEIYHALVLNGHFNYDGKDYYTYYNPSSIASFIQAKIKTNSEICSFYKNIRIMDKETIEKYAIWVVVAKN